MHNRARERPGDARHALDLGDDEAAKVIHVVRLGPDDDVVGARDVIGLGDAGDQRDSECYFGCLPDLGLDENVRLHHVALHGRGCHGNATVGAPSKKQRVGAPEAAITVADLGEFGLIAAIQAILPPDPSAIVGIGDDAAVLAVPDGRVVASTDLLIEGRHFRLDWSGPQDIGAKAAAQNLADIAAMGAVPMALLFGLAIPGGIEVAWVLDVARGMAAECGRAGATIAGGDVSSADAVMFGITALGHLAGREPVTRGGAKAGEVLAISSPVGWSAAGLALLQAGAADSSPTAARLAAAHRRPQPGYGAGPEAAVAGATAMIDVSDGLVADLGHIADASGVSLNVDTGSLPGVGELSAAAVSTGADWREWALAGGEDHSLAATFPSVQTVPATWTVIGAAERGRGVLVNGQTWDAAGGWDHFANPGNAENRDL
jgi:thiamine-monophosphate kinase